MSFSGDLSRFVIRATEASDQTRRAICLELFGSIVADTPVDSGRARGNWQTNVGSPKTGEINRSDPAPHGSPPGATVQAEISGNLGTLGDTVYFSNNLPYIGRLEFDGWSGQAPEGMVRRNVSRIQQLVAEQVRKNRL